MPIASMRASVRLSLSRKESVDALRKKIDQIDAKIVGFLNDRATLAQRIGHNKRLSNQEVYVPNREQEILHRVSRLNRGPLSEPVIRSVFREVIAACRSLESPLKVAFFGAEATFTHLAAREKFGAAITSVPTASISEVFQEVRQGRVSFGVVPIENSTEGVVAYTLDLLVDSDLKICAEIFLVIHHNLLSRSGRAEDIRKIVSHPQALAQCRGWLGRHFPNVSVEEVASTAHAAKMAAEDATLGAISSSLAKEVYDLQVVAGNIEDQSNNITRFLAIGDKDAAPSKNDKTSLVFSVRDQPGVLHRMLQPFARSRINLSKIESRPIKNKPWEYMFFLDLKGHKEEPRVKRALKDLERNCLFLKILGSYPSGR
jgi:chorismate mutase / prephenate dehydratase